MESEYPKTKQILLLLAVTGAVAASILIPGLPIALSPFLKKQYKKWGHFNKRRLKAELKRLQKTGVIEEIPDNGEVVFKLSDKGKQKVFKYQLEEISLKKNKWDKKWRLLIYDIPKNKKKEADAFRRLIKKLNFLKIQKSVYLTPYKCSNEIDFLKTLYHIEDHVTIISISDIDGEKSYKDYFGLT